MEPKHSSNFGKAWLVDLPAARARKGVTTEQDATIVAWIVNAPWAHPAWHSYAVILVHLRPMPDERKTIFYLEGATHEMWVYALDPDVPLEETISGQTLAYLTPCNFASQLICGGDDAAQKVIEEEAVKPIIAGTLSPDTDFRRAWEAKFGNNMVKAAYR